MTPVRTTVVAPVAAPYREPLFVALAGRPELALTVIYADAGQPSWDVPATYFTTAHAYEAVHLRSRQLPRPGRTPIMLPRGIEAALAATNPQVVIASEYGPAALRSRVWAGRHGIPYLLFTECTPEIDRLLPPAQLTWHRHFARHVDGALPVSSAARRRLLSFGVPAERITVALQSADLTPLRDQTPARRTPGRWNVLTVARLVPDKNVGVLLRAVAEAQLDLAASEQIHLDVAGDGFLRKELETMAGELDLDVTFHGHRSGAELAELYAHAEVFALLSDYEPFGVVIREAAAAGLPILASAAIGAVGDCAIAGENAVVVPPGNISAAAVALRGLADPARRAAMGQASRMIDADTAGTEVDAFITAIRRVADR